MSVQSAGINGRNKYLDILKDAWLEHLKPRRPDAPTVISLFAGAGGSSLGYSMAGYKELLAVEWDDNAVETFNLNFPDIQVWHGDITKLTVEECLEITGLKPGELDVLDGSPPCQGFSTAGKRQLDDPRNSLAKEYIRLLRGLKPKVFVMENVSGMVKGKMKLVFAEIMKELKASGYQVKCQLMNTMYFNVPQSRERLIWIGIRNDLRIKPKLPKPSNNPFTVHDALINCEIKDYTIPRSYSEWTEKLKPMQCVADIHPKGFGFNIRKLDWNKPSTTITKTHTPAVGLLHPEDNRFFSIPELMRLGSFPDNFKFAKTTTIFMSRQAAWERIGNSVPPLFMKAIAEYIHYEVLDRLTA